MNPAVRWAAEVSHVREVSLVGTADLAYWKDRLKREELRPAEMVGRTRMLIIAAELVYLGVRFRELSFSVAVDPAGTGAGEAAFLLRAFNTCSLFAFCERFFFSTPYHYGDVSVSVAAPSSLSLTEKRQTAFAAAMGATASTPARPAARQSDDGWDGPVFLPGKRRRGREGDVFFARLRGQTTAYPFVPGEDTLSLRPVNDALRALLESGFTPSEWLVREDAFHAKSRTYRRADVFAAGAAP